MSTGNKGQRRRLPAAATQSIPAASASHAESMTADEAAPAIEAAHDATDIAAAPLVAAVDMAPAPVAVPAAATDVTPPIPTPNPIIAEEEKTMDSTIQNAAQNTTEQAKAMFADAQDRTKGAVEKGQKLLAELTEFNKGNIEALVESSKIAARGFEAMGQDAVATAKSSFEDASQAMQTLATVKSPTEFMKLQADFARSAFDAMVQQTSRRTEASLKLAGEIAQPISNRVALAAEKIKLAA